MFGWIKALLLLPINVLIIIPSLILYFTKYQYKMQPLWLFMIGIVLFGTGAFFAIWTMILFYKIGKGTLAPWEPTKYLIIQGPYRYVRNPMILGVLSMLLGEYFLTGAEQLIWWFVLFFLINCIYFPLSEEKHLEEKFQDEYRTYKKMFHDGYQD